MYYKWIGMFKRADMKKIVTLRMNVPHKRYAYLTIDETVNELLEDGWMPAAKAELIRTDKDYKPI